MSELKYILVCDCEILRSSNSLKELIKYKLKYGHSWSTIYEIKEIENN